MAMDFTYDDGGAIRKIICDWTSNASGAAAGTTKKIVGRLLKGVTDPSATAPTDDYDIVITDEEGVDVLGQSHDDLANRDTANSEQVYFNLKSYDGTPVTLAAFPVVCDKLTVTVANAGDTKTGQLILYYEFLLP